MVFYLEEIYRPLAVYDTPTPLAHSTARRVVPLSKHAEIGV